MILDPAAVAAAIGVDPDHPRLPGVVNAAEELVLAYLERTVYVDPIPAAWVEAATHVASHLWHLPDLPAGSGGSAETGTLDLGGDVYAMVRSLLWPWRLSVGAV